MRKYNLTMAQLIDRLAIVTLKSIKIAENKEEYEKEAHEIMNDLDELLGEGKGQFIRVIQINAIVNEQMWSNESFVRKGESKMTDTEVANALRLTHAMNRVRNQAMNVISNIVGERKDLKLDYMDAETTKKFGYDFGKVFE